MNCSFVANFLKVKRNVMIPTLPINIKIIKIHLLTVDNSSVIPKDSPTVPNADVTSKNNDNTETSSISDKIIKLTNTIIIATIITVTAFCKSSSYTSRLNNFKFLPPRIKVIKNMTTSANVVVRIPPPALLGEAPINIKNDINKWFVSDNIDTSIVESPELLVVTDRSEERRVGKEC